MLPPDALAARNEIVDVLLVRVWTAGSASEQGGDIDGNKNEREHDELLLSSGRNCSADHAARTYGDSVPWSSFLKRLGRRLLCVSSDRVRALRGRGHPCG